MNIPIISFIDKIYSPIFIPLLTATFFLMLILSTLTFSTVKKYFNKIKKVTWFFLIIIIGIGFFSRIFLIDDSLTSYLDELSYVQTAKNILIRGKPLICSYSGYQSETCRFNDKAIGYSYLLTLVYLFSGVGLNVSYIVNLLLGTLTILMIFLTSYILFKDEQASLYSSLILALFPLHIIFSRTLETNISSTFFVLSTLFCFVLYLQIKNMKTKLLTISLMVFSVYLRPENLIIIPVFFLIDLFFLIKLKTPIKNFLVPLIILIILISPVLIQSFLSVYQSILFGRATPLAPIEGGTFSMNYFLKNYRILNKFKDGIFYPFLFNIFFFIGAFLCIKQPKKFGLLILFFTIFYSLILISYMHLHLRYLLTPLILFILLSGYGFSSIISIISSNFNKNSKKQSNNILISLLVFLSIIIILFSFIVKVRKDPDSLGNIYTALDKDSIIYLEIESVSKIDEIVNSDCYIIMENEIVGGITTKKIIPTRLIFEKNDVINNLVENKVCLFYFEDMYCTDYYSLGDVCGLQVQSFEKCEELRKQIVDRCKKIHENYKLVSFRDFEYNIPLHAQEKIIGNPKKIKFTLYNVSLNE